MADAEELYDQAVKATKAQQYAKAVQLSQQALALNPDFTDQKLLLGRLYMLTGNLAQARILVKDVLSRAPDYRDAYIYAINIEMTMKKWDEAECYVDEALYQFPNDRAFMLKKLGILDAAQKYYRAGLYATQLMDRHSDDTTVQKAVTGHYLLAGQDYLHKGNYGMAQQSYEQALAFAPDNEEAKSAITSMYIRSGSYTRAMEQIDGLLAVNPNSYDLMIRKLGLLQDTHNYVEAINFLQRVLKVYPNDAKVRAMETTLRMEAASYYTNMDPYLLYQGVLEKNPGNREALDKVIGLSMARGAYREAMAWINRGLKSNPNDKRLTGLKIDVLESDRKFTEAAMLAEKLRQGNPSNDDLRARVIYLKVASGRDYLAQQQYDLALGEFEKALQVDPADTAALDMVINTYMIQKDSTRALRALDNALASYPNNTRFLIKKSSLLADLGRYDEASELAADLLHRNPSDERFNANLADLRLTAGRLLLQQEEYDLAKPWFHQVLQQQPNNLDALNYLINLESAVQQQDSALYYANQALQYYPDNKELLLKKTGVLTDMKRYDEASAIAYQLMQRYPFTARYRTAYTETLMASGNAYQRNNAPDSALRAFKQVLAINKRDSLALLYSINILSSQQQSDSALTYANEGIRYYPNSTAFIQKRANLLESDKQYAAAALAADSLIKLDGSASNSDYADYLRSKTLKNQFGLFYLNSNYDYSSSKYNIATLEYRHFYKRGSWAGRVNYAGRAQGTGLMGEAELYYTHTPKLYSFAFAGYSNEVVFPRIRAGYSIFKTFKGDVEAELGARYLDADSAQVISGVASIAKTFAKDFYINFRAYIISDSSELYQSYNLTLRHYMNRQQDYIAVTAGLGTSPDDRSRLIQFPKLAGLLTRSVGAGYQKMIKYRTTIGIFGTWINQKITDTNFQNQYDVYLSLQRKF